MRKPCVESNGRSFTGRVYISAPQVCTRCTRSSTSTRDQLRGAKRRVITQRAHSLCFASPRHDTVLAPLHNKYIYIFDSRFTFTSLQTSLLSTENFQNFQHSDNKCNGYISSVSSTVVPQLSGYLYEQETFGLYEGYRIGERREEWRELGKEFFLLFLVFFLGPLAGTRARERNATSMGVAGRFLKGLADDVERGVARVGADVVFSFSRLPSSSSSFLPSGETRSITFPGHDTLSPFTSPSSVRQRRFSLRFLLSPSPIMMTIIAREPCHVCRGSQG